MIQQILNFATTLTGFIIGYSLNKIIKKFKKEEYIYPEIEITDYQPTLWDNI